MNFFTINLLIIWFSDVLDVYAMPLMFNPTRTSLLPRLLSAFFLVFNKVIRPISCMTSTPMLFSFPGMWFFMRPFFLFILPHLSFHQLPHLPYHSSFVTPPLLLFLSLFYLLLLLCHTFPLLLFLPLLSLLPFLVPLLCSLPLLLQPLVYPPESDNLLPGFMTM